MKTVCPHCGARMLVRHGVRLSPKRADLFDMIERISKTGSGITQQALAEIFYPRADEQRGKANVRVTISQLNDLFESTDVIIRSRYGNGYRIENRGQHP
jgi:DNA-binding response OmpR family regulator